MVRAIITPEHANCPRDAFYGYEPTVYTDEEEAECRAKYLAETGDWGEVGPPEYEVVECEIDELHPAELAELERN